MHQIGQLSTIMAFFVAAYGLGAMLVGLSSDDRRWLASGRRSILSIFLLLATASLSLTVSFLSNDFSVKYVAENSERALGTLYKIAGMWAGLEGSLLLWAVMLALFSLLAIKYPGEKVRESSNYAAVVLLAVMAFFNFLVAFVSSPFELLPSVPVDGNGLNPLLQNPAMILHPVALYLGYVGFTIPYAYAIAALWLKRTDDTWIRSTREWTMMAWLFLTLGIIWGGQWAYVELGWGGLWAWDPVENASLLPWLLATAFFHSAMIQEKRGMLKNWNIFLIVFTFLTTIFGTFLTRSGILASVHAFSQSNIGPYFLFFIGLILAASLYLIFDRGDLLKEEHAFESLFSKESSFLLNNLLLVGGTFAVLWGTTFPLVSNALASREITLGPPFFNRVMVPIGVATLALIGICPLIAWRRASWGNFRRNFLYPVVLTAVFGSILYFSGVQKPGALLAFSAGFFVVVTILWETFRGVRVRAALTGENFLLAAWRLFNRHPRRYGGYVVHLAVVLILVGIAGYTSYQQSREVTVTPGDEMQIGEYTLVYPGLSEDASGAVPSVYTRLEVKRDGELLGELRPEKQFHPKFYESTGPTTEVAIYGTLTHDLYVILTSWTEYGAQASFKLIINPLMSWIWIGAYLLVAGTLFAAWPRVRPLEAPER